MKMIAFM
jgi:hypothetical protein